MCAATTPGSAAAHPEPAISTLYPASAAPDAQADTFETHSLQAQNLVIGTPDSPYSLVLSTTPEHASLKVEHSDGYTLIDLTGNEDNSGLTVNDEAATPRAWLGLLDGSAQMILRDPEGQGRVYLYEHETANGLSIRAIDDQDAIVLRASESAQGLSLRNSEGALRARMWLAGDHPAFGLFSRNSSPVAGLIAYDNGAQFNFYGPNRSPRLSFYHTDVATGFSIADELAQERIRLRQDQHRGDLAFYHPNQVPAIHLRLAAERPTIAMRHVSGSTRLTLLGDDAFAGVVAYDSEDRDRTNFGVLNGQPILLMRDAERENRMGISVSDSGSSALRFNEAHHDAQLVLGHLGGDTGMWIHKDRDSIQAGFALESTGINLRLRDSEFNERIQLGIEENQPVFKFDER